MKYPDVIPMLAYEHGVAALDWLANAFGFQERDRWIEPDGTLSHGEMQAGDGVIMLATPTPRRRYRAEDLEGHRWFFCERKKG